MMNSNRPAKRAGAAPVPGPTPYEGMGGLFALAEVLVVLLEQALVAGRELPPEALHGLGGVLVLQLPPDGRSVSSRDPVKQDLSLGLGQGGYLGRALATISARSTAATLAATLAATTAPSGPPLSGFLELDELVQSADDFSFLVCVGSMLVSSWPRSFSTWLIQFATVPRAARPRPRGPQAWPWPCLPPHGKVVVVRQEDGVLDELQERLLQLLEAKGDELASPVVPDEVKSVLLDHRLAGAKHVLVGRLGRSGQLATVLSPWADRKPISASARAAWAER